jgi:hypothetical protein
MLPIAQPGKYYGNMCCFIDVRGQEVMYGHMVVNRQNHERNIKLRTNATHSGAEERAVAREARGETVGILDADSRARAGVSGERASRLGQKRQIERKIFERVRIF